MNDMTEALAKYFEAIKADYARWNGYASKDSKSFNEKIMADMIEEFNNGLEVVPGKKYLKIVTKSGSSRSVHSFIVTADDGKFKAGDILKAAGWNAPAKNQARGNIFGQYQIRWTGPNYLR